MSDLNYAEQATLTAKNLAEEIEVIDGYTDFTFKKIDNEWYKVVTFNLGEFENGQFFEDELKNIVQDFFEREFDDSKEIYLHMVDPSGGLRGGKSKIIVRALVEHEDYKVENLEEVGKIKDLVQLLDEFSEQFSDNTHTGFDFGEFSLEEQLEGVINGTDLRYPGDVWSVFYMDVRTDDNDKIDNIENLEEEGVGIDMELKSRTFIKEDDGLIYEVTS